MTWRGSTTPSDRFFASLVYLLPLLDAWIFSEPLFRQFPVLLPLDRLLEPLLSLYFGIPFIQFIIFLALFMLVVRNESVRHFIRFNTMQAILLGIVIYLFSLLNSFVLVPILGGTGLLVETLANVIFLGTIAAVIYSVAQSVLGRYAEIPTISNAVHMQVR
jgi:hypothetical protein